MPQSHIISHKSLKVVIRCLPPDLTSETFLEQVAPLPEYSFYYFVKSQLRSAHAYSRAYINFASENDMYIFKEKFDGYVFLDERGNEYTAIVEYAPFQKIPKKTRRVDARQGTIDEDADYVAFLEKLSQPATESILTPSQCLELIETKQKEEKELAHSSNTPLLEHMRKKREEKRLFLQRTREERLARSERGKRHDSYRDEGYRESRKGASYHDDGYGDNHYGDNYREATYNTSKHRGDRYRDSHRGDNYYEDRDNYRDDRDKRRKNYVDDQDSRKDKYREDLGSRRDKYRDEHDKQDKYCDDWDGHRDKYHDSDSHRDKYKDDRDRRRDKYHDERGNHHRDECSSRLGDSYRNTRSTDSYRNDRDTRYSNHRGDRLQDDRDIHSKSKYSDDHSSSRSDKYHGEHRNDAYREEHDSKHSDYERQENETYLESHKSGTYRSDNRRTESYRKANDDYDKGKNKAAEKKVPQFKLLKTSASSSSSSKKEATSEEKDASKHYVTSSYLREIKLTSAKKKVKSGYDKDVDYSSKKSYSRSRQELSPPAEEDDVAGSQKAKAPKKIVIKSRDSNDRSTTAASTTTASERERSSRDSQKRASASDEKDKLANRRTRNKDRPERAIYVPGKRINEKTKKDAPKSYSSKSSSKSSDRSVTPEAKD